MSGAGTHLKIKKEESFLLVSQSALALRILDFGTAW
jgi:hypothetical protein